jgi:hypothetical protein
LIVILHNALLPGRLCLVPGFPGHNALICSTISLLKVGHFDLQIPNWYSNIMDQVCLPCTFCSFVSKKNSTFNCMEFEESSPAAGPTIMFAPSWSNKYNEKVLLYGHSLAYVLDSPAHL